MRGKFNRAHHGVANMTRCFIDRRKHPRFFVMQIGVRQKDKSTMFDMVDAVDDVMIDGIGADSATSEAYSGRVRRLAAVAFLSEGGAG